MKLNTFNKYLSEEKAMDELHSLINKRYSINENNAIKCMSLLIERLNSDAAPTDLSGGNPNDLDGKDVGKNDLEEFAGSSVEPGIRMLQTIMKNGGDDLLSDEVELAARTWSFLRDLLKGSASGLKEQISITNIGKKYKNKDEIKVRPARS